MATEINRGLFITENQLDSWVTGNIDAAKGLIVELVYKLVVTSCQNPSVIRFPFGDSQGQAGFDGVLETEHGFTAFVPDGKSVWEMGVGGNPNDKATKDYKKATEGTSKTVRQTTTFVFVTPHSGTKWSISGKKVSQLKWIETRKKQKQWRDIKVIDGTQIIHWLRWFPAIERWLAERIGGNRVEELLTPEERWADLKEIGKPPLLIPKVFLVGRENACKEMKNIFDGSRSVLRLDTKHVDQVRDFVSAYIANMGSTEKEKIYGRCMIATTPEALKTLIQVPPKQYLFADFDADDLDGLELIDKAQRVGHSIIVRGRPGGRPYPDRVDLTNPKPFQIQEVLKEAGHSEERSRVIGRNSDGNLNSMKLCLLGVSRHPGWAQGTVAADFTVMQFLGSWTEGSEEDKKRVEEMLGKKYGECVRRMREITLQPGIPLTHREGKWKVSERYECWSSLGPKVIENDLKVFKDVAVKVLKEKDPQFDLPPDDRYMASIRGKVLKHSRFLRHGISESLALLGSYPNALTECSTGMSENIAATAIREIFTGADWTLWASLNEYLPLLAEAAPNQFLDLVENVLTNEPNLFPTIFGQERTGVAGRNYMTGLLWALESLAWSPDNLTRVVLILAELSSIDPGGNWGNRPTHSISTIFLPWFPQTCASVEKRVKSIEILMNEFPKIAWELLLTLLPGERQSSSGSHKPVWREYIPDDWSNGVKGSEYWGQIDAYSELVFKATTGDVSKIERLIERLDHLPPPVRNKFITFLNSEDVSSLAVADKTRLWNQLTSFVTRHKRFSKADWTIKSPEIDEIEAAAKTLAPNEPFFRHQKLFIERNFELYEESDNFEAQAKKLEERRDEAVQEIFGAGGLNSILKFSEAVDTPWRVGLGLGSRGPVSVDQLILPALLESENKSHFKFCGGFVLGRSFYSEGKWGEAVDTTSWTSSQKGQFFAYLPFAPSTWKLVEKNLGENDSFYWTKANANPYEAGDGIDRAVEQLIKHGRPHEALGCLGWQLHTKKEINSKLGVAVLMELLKSTGEAGQMDSYYVQDVIKALQIAPDANQKDLLKIEWAYLPLLDRFHDGSPTLLESKLVTEPEFFCELIKTIYVPKGAPKKTKKLPKEMEHVLQNAYRLLSEWRTPPGTLKDGNFSAEALNGWLEVVRKTCDKNGRLDVALIHVGHILAYSPQDKDGLWIHHAVAKVLNRKDSEQIRHGFCIELFNSRGAFAWNAGKEERGLAIIYREKAEAVEKHGYHLLAKSLREMADNYDRDAEREEKRDLFEDRF